MKAHHHRMILEAVALVAAGVVLALPLLFVVAALLQ